MNANNSSRLILLHEDGEQLKIRVKRDMKFGTFVIKFIEDLDKIRALWTQKTGDKNVKLYRGSNTVSNDDTPASLGLTDESVIRVEISRKQLTK